MVYYHDSAEAALRHPPVKLTDVFCGLFALLLRKLFPASPLRNAVQKLYRNRWRKAKEPCGQSLVRPHGTAYCVVKVLRACLHWVCLFLRWGRNVFKPRKYGTHIGHANAYTLYGIHYDALFADKDNVGVFAHYLCAQSIWHHIPQVILGLYGYIHRTVKVGLVYGKNTSARKTLSQQHAESRCLNWVFPLYAGKLQPAMLRRRAKKQTIVLSPASYRQHKFVLVRLLYFIYPASHKRPGFRHGRRKAQSIHCHIAFLYGFVFRALV